jgi:tetratricopeptide (TPR) repeat protein
MTTPSFKIQRKDIFFIIIIIMLSLFFKAFYLKDYARTNMYPVLTDSDSYCYHIWAKDIISGDLWGPDKAFMKWPLYAYFLAGLLKLFGGSITSVYLLQFMLGSANCVLVYFIARIIFNEAVGFIAALFCAWYGLFMFYEGQLIYTSLSLFLNSLLFLSILFIQGHSSKKNLFWIGIFLGVCVITQANIIIFGILAIAWVLWEKRLTLSKFIYYFAYFILGLSIIIGSVVLRNYLVEKDFVLIAGNMGVTFYMGNNRNASGAFQCPPFFTPGQNSFFRDSGVIARVKAGRDLKTSEISNFWFNRSAAFIKNYPQEFIKLIIKKLAYVFSPQELIHENEYRNIVEKIRVFKIMLLDLRLILPLALFGMSLNLRNFKRTFLLYLVVASLSISIVLFYVATRYRIIMVPFLAIFAASGIFSVGIAFKDRKYLKFGLFCLAIAAVLLLFNQDILVRKPYTQIKKLAEVSSHLDKAREYSNKSDYGNAMKEAEQYYRMEPSNFYGVLELGVAYYNTGNLKMSEEKFKEVIRLNPFSVDAYYNLGFIYNSQQRFKEAQDMLKKVLSLNPQDTGAHFELGRAYKASGEFREAREEFNLALNKLSRWRTAERATIIKELNSLNK